METVLHLENISLKQGKNFTLSIKYLQFISGRIYALTGPNGAGKSTLLRIMAMLESPQEGTVSLRSDGLKDTSQQRQYVTLVEQSPYLLQGTVVDNLAFGLKLRGVGRLEQNTRIASSLAMVGLEGFEGRKANSLSGGEVQRVALARALALRPQVLLLDEPTSNIDSKSLRSFEQLLRRLSESGITVVFSTHDLEQPNRLDSRTIQLQGGQLLEKSPEQSRKHDQNRTEKELWLNPLNVQGV